MTTQTPSPKSSRQTAAPPLRATAERAPSRGCRGRWPTGWHASGELPRWSVQPAVEFWLQHGCAACESAAPRGGSVSHIPLRLDSPNKQASKQLVCRPGGGANVPRPRPRLRRHACLPATRAATCKLWTCMVSG